MQFVFASLALLLFLLAGGVYNSTVEKIGGAVGIVCGLSAMYTGWYVEADDTFRGCYPWIVVLV